ncbi:DNA topoisomerase (ATP-hydrolyzing) subunit A [Microcoleus sp. FACHB-1515]|uniref:DNA topoisomerase (ATP-hydrolyzing) subunit A n=1 Tax=Cyanophyceae TaxID=3028117 RepID=UPI001682BE42|nr:DNA topoisomerase (ATP-hydrolyzing) subunit A [Microcoleus sp. FACHB-1515]MBD2092157.1 DNA topoisomerase (ATP-hydrolyzing) subunit A [Microcoleus sp. FACHB-1515]
MARQLNMLPSGQVITTALHTEVQRSYLEYAMSVIVGRALPDVRDGLKPVHRRILYAMHELGLTPDRPYRKCARVVGDVLGKYHPHGDQAVYDALVRLVQDFSTRYPLLGGHGNFGSVDNDPPAAMRYTETRLAAIGHEAMLSEIGDATVDFIGNFDNSQQEPIVLPAQLPFLVLNGSSGIAVGMATNIPPHNVSEVIDGLVALIDQPDLSDDDLFALIPAPDFPTGGEIIGTAGIREAYTTGRGSITMRGIASFEEVAAGRGRHRRTAIVVTELPYQVNKAAWIEKIAELVNQGKIEGIADIRDESDRDGMRVVIELRREASPQRILTQLHKQTPLQSNFGAIMLALVDGQPRQLPLRELLQQFLNFRETTLTRQYQYELDQAESRSHLVEGLLGALSNLDAVIDILRNAPDGSTAKGLMQEQFGFSDRQSDAILSMPLRRLTGLERQNLQNEFDELNKRMQELRKLLGDRRELLKSLKKDLRALKRKFGDDRRTRIQADAIEVEAIEPEVSSEPEQPVVLEFTQRGYIRRRTPKQKQAEGNEDDPIVKIESATTHQEMLVLTKSGKAYSIAIRDIPQTPRHAKGTAIASLLPNAEAVLTQFVLTPETQGRDLILLTQQGRIKRLPLNEFTNLTGRGLTAAKLKDDDELQLALLAKPNDQIILAASGGRLLSFALNDEQLPIQARTTQGLQAMRVGKQETIVGCVAIEPTASFTLITSLGYAKRLPASVLKPANRGGLGMQAIQFATKTDAIAGLTSGNANVLTSDDRLLPLLVDDLKPRGKEGAGDRVFKLNKAEKIVTVLGGA